MDVACCHTALSMPYPITIAVCLYLLRWRASLAETNKNVTIGPFARALFLFRRQTQRASAHRSSAHGRHALSSRRQQEAGLFTAAHSRFIWRRTENRIRQKVEAEHLCTKKWSANGESARRARIIQHALHVDAMRYVGDGKASRRRTERGSRRPVRGVRWGCECGGARAGDRARCCGSARDACACILPEHGPVRRAPPTVFTLKVEKRIPLQKIFFSRT